MTVQILEHYPVIFWTPIMDENTIVNYFYIYINKPGFWQDCPFPSVPPPVGHLNYLLLGSYRLLRPKLLSRSHASREFVQGVLRFSRHIYEEIFHMLLHMKEVYKSVPSTKSKSKSNTWLMTNWNETIQRKKENHRCSVSISLPVAMSGKQWCFELFIWQGVANEFCQRFLGLGVTKKRIWGKIPRRLDRITVVGVVLRKSWGWGWGWHGSGRSNWRFCVSSYLGQSGIKSQIDGWHRHIMSGPRHWDRLGITRGSRCYVGNKPTNG